MLTRQGPSNRWCFAHSGNHKCGLESYVHKTAKIILADRFNNGGIPFIVHFEPEYQCRDSRSCPHEKYRCGCRSKSIDYNLRDHYDLPPVIELQVNDADRGDSFRPDVILRSSNPARKDIFLEVYHTHKSSMEKIQSGARIIEIRIRDLFDLEKLKNQEKFSESLDVCFYNFRVDVSPERILELNQEYARECGTELPPDAFPPCLSNPMMIQKYGKCPRCGGSLILRSGTYGRFYGCSNYPRCTTKYRIL